MSGIYRILNIITLIVYIGSASRTFDIRWRKHTKEAILKIKNTKYPRDKEHHQYGKPITNEVKEKISKANTGRCHTEETKLKLSIERLGHLNPMYGRHLTLEQKRLQSERMKCRQITWGKKISEALSAENSSNAKLNWTQVEEIRRLVKFNSESEVAKLFGVARSTISDIKHSRTWKVH